MDEIEVPLEQLQEDIHHHAMHGGERWLSLGAVLSAFLAVFAAISALTAGHHANEAMIDQIRASDAWSFFQAKSIKASILETRIEVLKAMGKPVLEANAKKLEEYRSEQKELQKQAKEYEETSEHHLVHHQILAKSVTMFQIAIALTAISVLVRRRQLMWVSTAFGAIGLGFLGYGLLVAG